MWNSWFYWYETDCANFVRWVKLEYRGYDSADIAVRDGENPTEVVKATGKLHNLCNKSNDGKYSPNLHHSMLVWCSVCH